MVASFGCILMQALPATAFIIYYFFFILYLCSAPFILIYGGKQKKWCRAEKPNPQGLPEGVPSGMGSLFVWENNQRNGRNGCRIKKLSP